jgi:hypothetical protein
MERTDIAKIIGVAAERISGEALEVVGEIAAFRLVSARLLSVVVGRTQQPKIEMMQQYVAAKEELRSLDLPAFPEGVAQTIRTHAEAALDEFFFGMGFGKASD